MPDIPDPYAIETPDNKTQTGSMKFISRASLLLAMVATLVGGTGFFSSVFQINRIPTDAERLEVAEQRADRAAFNRLRDEVNEIKSTVDSITGRPLDTPEALAIRELQGRITAIDSRLTQFQNTISRNPLERLETVIIRKDLEVLTSNTVVYQDAVQDELNRLYGQNTFFIGLIVTTLLALIGYMFANRPK